LIPLAANSSAAAIASSELPAQSSARSYTGLLDMGASFPREARVLDAAGYDHIFKRNKRVSSRYWTVLGHRRERIVRESFRHHQQQLCGLDVVVMNKDAAVNASRLELRESLDSLWIELSTAQANKSGR